MIYVIVVNLIAVAVVVNWISLVWDMRLGKGSNTIKEIFVIGTISYGEDK